MALPDPLAAQIDALRTIIRTVNTTDVGYKRRKALGCVANLRTWIRHDPAIEPALQAVVRNIKALADAISAAGYAAAYFARPGDPAIGKARKKAMTGVDVLETRLAHA